MKEHEMKIIADWVADTLKDIGNTTRQEEIKREVKKLCEKFPVYQS